MKNHLKYMNKLIEFFVIISSQEFGMKKIIIFALMLLFTGINANAAVINYNAAGGVTSVSGGYGPYGRTYTTGTINNYGSNAQFAPNTLRQTQQRAVRESYERQYIENLKNTKNINVNINHNGYPYYTNNAYNRYYPGGYRYNYVPANYSNGIYYNTGNGISIPGIRMY